MGNCDGATQSECQWLFPVTDFDIISMVSRPYRREMETDVLVLPCENGSMKLDLWHKHLTEREPKLLSATLNKVRTLPNSAETNCLY